MREAAPIDARPFPDTGLDRARFVAEIAANPKFDVLIVGGGIAGAATFRDLAHQRLRCLLIERGDFASGASGALTRVAQGGFRYLEKGELRLVARAVTERNLFVAAAPHQVRPLRVVLPSESLFGGAATAVARALGRSGGHSLPGAAVLRAAVALYQRLGRKTRVLPRGGMMLSRELQRRYPGISPRYKAAAYEFEGLVATPERVAIELLEDGVAASRRSVALNFTEIAGFDDGEVVLRHALSEEALHVRSQVVVNAAGANVDRVLKLFGVEARLVDGVAGTHLILCAPEIAEALGDDLLFFEDANPDPRNKRLCCVYAVGANVLIGATEIPVRDADMSRAARAEDVYLLAALAHLFPDAVLRAEDIVGRLHGVRPLVAASDTDVTGRSRDHAIRVHHGPTIDAPIVSIAGGKWTTFRAIAEDAADAVLPLVGRPRLVSTAKLAIGGGANGADPTRRSDDLMRRFGLDAATADRLVGAYGSRAGRVARWLVRPGGRDPIAGAELTVGEVRFFAAEELAASADDVVRRRTRLFLEGRATPELCAAIDRALAGGRAEPDRAKIPNGANAHAHV